MHIELCKSFTVTFSYIPTKKNPADLASRGSTASSLKSDTLWWTGPSVCRESPSPFKPDEAPFSFPLSTPTPSVSVLTMTATIQTEDPLDPISYFLLS
ncbi:unnamed protein product [Auanema sp. JU1783]|nr:unnamed protein product [Auanema sp. JU1783]